MSRVECPDSSQVLVYCLGVLYRYSDNQGTETEGVAICKCFSAEMHSRAPGGLQVSDLFIPNLQSRWGPMVAHISWTPSPSEHWADTVHRPKILSRQNPKIRFSSFKLKLPDHQHPPTTNPLTNRGIPTPPTYQANATQRKARLLSTAFPAACRQRPRP